MQLRATFAPTLVVLVRVGRDRPTCDVFCTGLHWSEYSTLYLDLERILNVAMPRKPTSEHSYEDRKLRSPMKYRSTRRGVFSYEGELKPFVFIISLVLIQMMA
jgi:hypothetical protein